MKKKRTIQIGPCGPALDEWGWALKDFIDDYRAKNPDSLKTYEELSTEFETTHPYPQPLIIPIPSLWDKIKEKLRENKTDR